MDDEHVGSGSKRVKLIGNLQGLWPMRSPEIDEKICINLFGQNPSIFHLQWAHSLLSITSISIWIKVTFTIRTEAALSFEKLEQTSYSINVTQYTSVQSFLLFLSKATCFDQKLVISRHLQHFRYRMLCPLWDPIVECISFFFTKWVIYRLCLNIKILKILP